MINVKKIKIKRGITGKVMFLVYNGTEKKEILGGMDAAFKNWKTKYIELYKALQKDNKDYYICAFITKDIDGTSVGQELLFEDVVKHVDENN